METNLNKQVNITPLLQKAALGNGNVAITETPGMYTYKTKVEDNWAYYTAEGFKILKKILEHEKKPAGNFAIVGIGSGVEGILALKVFAGGLDNLVVSDIDNEILKGAQANILSTAKQYQTTFLQLIKSFTEPMQALPFKFNVIYGNIPNLPSKVGQDLKFGDEKGTFLPIDTFQKYGPPPEFAKWAMAAQYAYLQSAKKVLKAGGSILTELGGRMPLETVQKLFDTCGFKMDEILVGFKEQTEPLMDFAGYHEFENRYGVKFDFYKYEESKKLMEEKGITNPTNLISGENLKKLLAPFKVNAGQALELFKQGIAVGHTVHIFRGIYE